MKIFISHSENNENLAKVLKNILEKFDQIDDVFIFEEKMRLGIQIDKKITDEIDQSDFLVAIITDESIGSASVNQELGYAQGLNIEKIPMIKRGIKKGFLVYGTENIDFSLEDFENKCHIVGNYIIQNNPRDKISKEDEKFVQISSHFRYALRNELDDILDSMIVRLGIVSDMPFRDYLMNGDIEKRKMVYEEFKNFINSDDDKIKNFLKSYWLDSISRFSKEYDDFAKNFNHALRFPHADIFPDEIDAFQKLKERILNIEEGSFDLQNKIWDYLPPQKITTNYSTYLDIIKEYGEKNKAPIHNYLNSTAYRLESFIRAVVNMSECIDDIYRKFGDKALKTTSV